MIASTKVKAGIKLSMAALSVGELYWIPTNEKTWEEHLQEKWNKTGEIKICKFKSHNFALKK